MLENQWSRPFLISLAQGSVDLRNQWLTASIGFHESELLGLVGHYWDSFGLTRATTVHAPGSYPRTGGGYSEVAIGAA